MRNHYLVFAIVLGVLLLLTPVPVEAKFAIEFADGHQMTVANYEETGDTVKVYTSLGSFAFQKKDIVKITDLDAGKKAKKASTPATTPPAPSSVKATVTAPPVAPPTQAPAAPTQDPSPLEGVAAQIEDGLFRMRYIFALIAGVKALKIFFAASAR